MWPEQCLCVGLLGHIRLASLLLLPEPEYLEAALSGKARKEGPWGLSGYSTIKEDMPLAPWKPGFLCVISLQHQRQEMQQVVRL